MIPSSTKSAPRQRRLRVLRSSQPAGRTVLGEGAHTLVFVRLRESPAIDHSRLTCS